MFDKFFNLLKSKKEQIEETIEPTIFDESRIIKDFRVTNKWSKGKNRTNDDVIELVLHGTGGGSNVKSLLQWMLNGERAKSYKQNIGLFPFAIDLNGDIYQLVDNPGEHWFWHSNSGNHDKNTIGVELLNQSSQNTNSYTEAQYNSLFWLAFEYMPYYFENYTRIVGHDYNYNLYQHNKKGCPGSGFSWQKMQDELAKRNIEFKWEGFECFYDLEFPEGENNG